MNLKTFNVTLLLGWLLALVGGVVLNVGAGLLFAGLLLIALAFAVARLAGLYAAAAADTKEAG